ncbi:polymorphic toxin-type HINT domain-containing protein [uncultured Brevibacillus sp.]|uniref:polymorphic toxin-type HINT domain-containing protein n=1 Tax=uncultured Brevibacillus sp. TaxID=169970 RepID=UPI002598C5B9|nr:polymorphic toxin-type HINT domain-containing protein [uncultured Brevibacillus sp.]
MEAIWNGIKKAGNELPGAVSKAAHESVIDPAMNDINTLIDDELTWDDAGAAVNTTLTLITLGRSKQAANLLKTTSKEVKVVKNTSVKISACNCFSAGTKVKTDEGEKPIEEIEVGDKVLAKSDETGEVAYKEVVGLFQKQADEIYYVHIGDEIIEVTGEHPFWLDGKGWTFVKDLKAGDLLVSSDGSKLAIDKIEKEPREATVYNFEVEDFHSYFVSNLGIWVHNCAVVNLPSARWINHDVYNELTRLQLDKKFVKAKDMGYARAREGADGIISLTENEIVKHKGYTYDYKIKVVGAPNHVRVYGRIDENGGMVFDYMTSGKK